MNESDAIEALRDILPGSVTELKPQDLIDLRSIAHKLKKETPLLGDFLHSRRFSLHGYKTFCVAPAELEFSLWLRAHKLAFNTRLHDGLNLYAFAVKKPGEPCQACNGEPRREISIVLPSGEPGTDTLICRVCLARPIIKGEPHDVIFDSCEGTWKVRPCDPAYEQQTRDYLEEQDRLF